MPSELEDLKKEVAALRKQLETLPKRIVKEWLEEVYQDVGRSVVKKVSVTVVVGIVVIAVWLAHPWEL